jgi:hypothetical protein
MSAEVFGAHGGRIEAAAVVVHLDQNGAVLCRDADGSAVRPSVFDHIRQGFLAEAVQLLLDLRIQRQALTRPVDFDYEPFPGAERRCVLGEGGDQSLLGERTRPQLEDEGGHLGQRTPGQLTNLAQLFSHPASGIQLLQLQRTLRGSDVECSGEEGLPCGSTPVAGPPGPATCTSGRVPIWNNDGDTATLIDPNNVTISRYRY